MERIKHQRLCLLDSIRGITLISMILYHTFWNIVHIFNIFHNIYYSNIAYIWQQSICWTFIIISGFSFSLSNNHLKRGVIIFSSGILISVLTYLFLRQSVIIFGILTFLGSAVLLTIPIKKFLKKLNPIIGAVISFLLFFILRDCNNGNLGFEGLLSIKLPKLLYSNYFTAFFGFPHNSFYSSDYFSIFPWYFLFLFGFFIYGIFEKCNLTEKLLSKGKIPVAFTLGRNSLLVYLLHQPILYGICLIIKTAC